MTHTVPRLMPLVCLALFSMHLPAHASVPDSAKPVYAAADAALTANAGVASQYVWRGLRQTDGKPVAQAGIDYVHPSGWSAGTLVSHVGDRTVANGSIEWNLYGGYSGKLGEFGYSLIGHVARYPGAGRGPNGARFDYGELSAGVSYKALYAKYNYTVTRDFFGIANARGTGYLDGGQCRRRRRHHAEPARRRRPGRRRRQRLLELARREGWPDASPGWRLESGRRVHPGIRCKPWFPARYRRRPGPQRAHRLHQSRQEHAGGIAEQDLLSPGRLPGVCPNPPT
jgi:Bacterial protein of unknown function (Gcw_chp)